MTEKECLAAGIVVSLFAHFALLIAPRPPKPEPSFTTVVQMDMASPAVATSREKGIGIAAASGKVRRPTIIGTEPIPVILHVKYQYGLR